MPSVISTSFNLMNHILLLWKLFVVMIEIEGISMLIIIAIIYAIEMWMNT